MRGRRLAFAIGLALLALMAHLADLSSALLGNVAWSGLAKASVAETPQEDRIADALRLFQRAVEMDGSNRRALFGMGMAHAISGDEEAALANWEAGEPNTRVLVELGNLARNDEKWNRAMLFFKGAASLEHVQPNEGRSLAGQVCQLIFAEPGLLNSSNQVFCREYWARNGDNLIVNGGFNDGNMWGWYERYWSGFSGRYQVDQKIGRSPPAAAILGLAEEEVGGFSQGVTLPAGTTVRYSAWIKVQRKGDMEVRLLHVVWQRKDGKAGGNQLRAVAEDMDWAFLERVVQIPEAEGSLFWFSPALLTGIGTVWIDDVQLELIAEQ